MRCWQRLLPTLFDAEHRGTQAKDSFFQLSIAPSRFNAPLPRRLDRAIGLAANPVDSKPLLKRRSKRKPSTHQAKNFRTRSAHDKICTRCKLSAARDGWRQAATEGRERREASLKNTTKKLFASQLNMRTVAPLLRAHCRVALKVERMGSTSEMAEKWRKRRKMWTKKFLFGVDIDNTT
ncbi:hypothetical protein BDY21DRAFT_76590 [Lineolata rhizophorae]|uniref:Uncharacterized protein n=1 Tax=Lineolata rhizophorae TaxID=578093 RepID=A0A6A6NTC8_9PEZI|nr:hypothetical protein BDY21DRAFT_76590 [Lineolata rhizophorae]